MTWRWSDFFCGSTLYCITWLSRISFGSTGPVTGVPLLEVDPAESLLMALMALIPLTGRAWGELIDSDMGVWGTDLHDTLLKTLCVSGYSVVLWAPLI